MSSGQPIGFYIRGIVALGLLLALTSMMEPAPAVSYLRAMIGVGLGIVILKMTIRQYRPHWLPDRFGGTRRR